MALVLEGGISEDELTKRDVEGNLPHWLERHGGAFDDYFFVPIHSRYRVAFIGIRKTDGEFVDIVEIPPPMESDSYTSNLWIFPGRRRNMRPRAGIAQLVEQLLRKQLVGGSSPLSGTICCLW